MKRRTGRTLLRCVVGTMTVLLIAMLSLPCAAQEEQKILRVAFPQAEGYTITASDGSRQGVVVDFLNEIAKYTGWEYEYIDVDNDVVAEQFLAGEFDLMGGTYYAESYEEYFAYPDYHCGYSKQVLLSRKDDDTIKSYDLNTLNGKTIGVYDRNKENIRRMQAYLDAHNLSCHLKYYDYEQLSMNRDLHHYLKNGEIDLFLGNSTDVENDLYIATTFSAQPHYIVAQNGDQEVLDGLNMALEKIYESDAEFAEKEYDKNFVAIDYKSIELTEEELDYIKQKKTVTVAVPFDWHPLVCINNVDEEHDGLALDVLSEIAEYSGLEFSYVYCNSYVESLRKVQNGEVDMAGFFVGEDQDATEYGLALTSSYTQLDTILVRNRKSSYPAPETIGSTLEGWKMPDDITVDDIQYYSSVSEALSDVNNGKLDFFYGISSHLENIIQQNNFTKLVQVNLINNSSNISFALKRPAQYELFVILNKGIHSISDEKKAAINGRNIVSIGGLHMTVSGIIYANPALAIAIVSAFLLLVLAVVIMVSQYHLHSVVMRAELERAEADSRAKSEFLSRMSHEIRTPMNAIVGLTELTGMVEGLPQKAQQNLAKIQYSAQYLLSLISDILDMSRIESKKMNLSKEPFSIRELFHEIESMMMPTAEEKGLEFKLENEVREGDDVVLGDAVRLRQILLNLLSNAFKFTPRGGSVLVRVAEDASTENIDAFTIQVIDTGVGIAPADQQRIFYSFEQVGSNIAKSQGTGLGLAISRHIVQSMGGELKVRSELGKGCEFYFTIALPKEKTRKAYSTTPAATKQNDMLKGVNILLAEDNDLNAEIASELLSAQGATVTRAENGKIACSLFEHSEPGTYQIILMDILMPEMDGLQATRAIRALPRSEARTIPIIAMTANAFQGDVQATLEAGMTGFVPKPVDVQYLYRVLCDALKQVQPPARDL